MKYGKYGRKILSLCLAAVMCCLLFGAGVFTAGADTFFDEGDFRYAVTSGDKLMAAKYLGSDTCVTVPASVGGRQVTGVYSRCFENSGVGSVALPEGCTVIGAFAFSGCSCLSEVIVPASLTSVGIMAFSGCTALRELDLSEARDLSSVAYAAFSNCTALEHVIFPDGLTVLGDDLFSGCTALQTAELPKHLTTISGHAFYNCTSLKSIELPNGLQTIGELAFAGCSQLEEIDLPFTLTSLGAGCFQNDTGLSGIFLPDSLTSIGMDILTPMSEQSAIDVTCYEDSHAEEYCLFGGVSNLYIVEKTEGDVDRDGRVTINDVTAIQKHLALISEFESYRILDLADIERNGVININDATRLQRRLAGIE